MGGILEEWDMRYLLVTNRVGWSAFPGQPMSDIFAARPLTPLPFAFGNLLDPASFNGLHVLLLIACLTKVIAGAAIGWWLFRDRRIALVIGALALVVPADTQQIALRNVHINIAVALLLVACLLSLQALYKRAGSRRWCMAGAVGTGVVGCWIYEPVFTLYCLPPLLIYARLGLPTARRLLRKRRSAVLLWTAGVAISGSYLFYMLVIRKTTYQVELAGGKDGGVLKSVVGNAYALIDSAAYRIAFDSWQAAWNIATVQTAHWVYFPAAFLFVLALLLFTGGRKSKRRCSAALVVRSTVVGALITVAGYAPVLVSLSHVALTQRTFLAAAPGAAILIASLLALVGLALPRAMILLAALAISLGLVAQVYQHDVYSRAYNDLMHPYLKAVASRSDPSKSVHLVMDESGLGGYLGGIYVSKLVYGVPQLRSVLGDSYTLCKSERLQESMPFSNCRLEGDSWIVSSSNKSSVSKPAAAVDVIHMPPVSADEAFVRPDPPFSPFLPRRGPSEIFDCSADSMWGYSRFCPGEGWSDGVAYRTEGEMRSEIRAVEPDPTLFFRLLPVARAYELHVSFAQPLPNVIATRWGIEINGAPVKMRAVNATLYNGHVPAAQLNSGANFIKFSNAFFEHPTAGLSIQRISLVPEGNKSIAELPGYARLKPGHVYTIGEATLRSALISGFSVPEPVSEPTGIWTDGGEATLVFSTKALKLPAVLEVSAVPFLNEKHQSIEVEAWINGSRTATFRFSISEQPRKMNILLPADRVREGGPIELRLMIKNPASPETVGAGNRFLGIFIQKLKLAELPRLELEHAYTIGEATLRSALISGFSVPEPVSEPTGIWTDGGEATLVFSTKALKLPAVLEVSAVPFLNEKHQSIEVEAWINGSRTATFRFSISEQPRKMNILLPADRVREGGPIELRLMIKNPASPETVGAGNRFLGIFIQELKLTTL